MSSNETPILSQLFKIFFCLYRSVIVLIERIFKAYMLLVLDSLVTKDFSFHICQISTLNLLVASIKLTSDELIKDKTPETNLTSKGRIVH